ncbi:hypothetical protein [Microcoleus sp.]|uniref:hypothetical protein n=1 Tax=Microcoleus sp. TaxID=44472 RepID=UPI00403E9676
MSQDRYQLGGSLTIDAPSYVEREADSQLYEALKRGEFCYVLNSGKWANPHCWCEHTIALKKTAFAALLSI